LRRLPGILLVQAMLFREGYGAPSLLEGVMNFGSETVAFWHDYSNTIPK
jgi:hypothetical protein